MDRKRFLTATGLLGLSSALSIPTLLGQQTKLEEKKFNPMKEKIVLKDEG